MKKIIYILIIGFIQTTSLLSQCCPYLDNFEIVPANPNSNDTIYLISDVTTPNLGSYLGYELTDNDTMIVVEACYYWGLLTALQNFKDTINLGVKEAGTYNLQYIAYQSNSPYDCSPIIGENSHAFYFEVTTINPVFTTFDTFDVNYFPNPVVDKVNIVSGQMIEHIELFDSQGKLLVSDMINGLQHTLELTKIPIGVYFLKVRNKNNKLHIKKIIKY